MRCSGCSLAKHYAPGGRWCNTASIHYVTFKLSRGPTAPAALELLMVMLVLSLQCATLSLQCATDWNLLGNIHKLGPLNRSCG